MTNLFLPVLWWHVVSFITAMRTHTRENCSQLQVLSGFTYHTNMIVCNEKGIPEILMMTDTAMRTPTGEKPAQLQVPSRCIYPTNSSLFVMTTIIPLVVWWHPLSFCSAIRTHADEKPALYPMNMFEMKNVLFWWWQVLRFFTAMRTHTGEKPEHLQVQSGFKNPTNSIFCNNILIHTVSMATCTQFLHCHKTHTSEKPA